MAKKIKLPEAAQEPLFADQDQALKNLISKTHDVEIVRPDKPKRGRPMQGWVQAEAMAHEQLWKLNMKNPNAVSILMYMIARMSRKATGYVVSATTLSAEMGMSVRTVQTAIQMLKQYDFVQILKSGNTNVYVVNSQVAWRGERGSRQAVFNASIQVAEREQDETVEQLEEAADRLLPVPDLSMFGARIDTLDLPEGEEPRFVDGNGEEGDDQEEPD